MTALAVYRGLTRASAPLLRAHLKRRARRGKEDAARLAERFGIASTERPAGPLVWLHAASVGEALSVLPLLAALRRHTPHAAVLLTTGTRSSAEVLAGRLPAGTIHQYAPLDHPVWVARFLDTWRPDLALFAESELWPNALTQARARGTATALVNARMSARSYRAWRRLPGLIRPLLAGFDAVLAQNPDQARRLAALGARAPAAPGNLKRAAEPASPNPAALAELRAGLGTRPRWLAASTHPGEEAAAASVHTSLAPRFPGLATLIAPRHPERGDAVARELRARGLAVARRSRGEPFRPETDVYILDTLGELSLLYSVAEIAFVGGSLTPCGGHNPVEPGHFGCAVLHGPDMANAGDLVAELDGAGRVADIAELREAVAALLADPAARDRAGRRARAMARRQTDVPDAVLARLAPLLARLDPAASAA